METQSAQSRSGNTHASIAISRPIHVRFSKSCRASINLLLQATAPSQLIRFEVVLVLGWFEFEQDRVQATTCGPEFLAIWTTINLTSSWLVYPAFQTSVVLQNPAAERERDRVDDCENVAI